MLCLINREAPLFPQHTWLMYSQKMWRQNGMQFLLPLFITLKCFQGTFPNPESDVHFLHYKSASGTKHRCINIRMYMYTYTHTQIYLSLTSNNLWCADTDQHKPTGARMYVRTYLWSGTEPLENQTYREKIQKTSLHRDNEELKRKTWPREIGHSASKWEGPISKLYIFE